MNCLGQSVRRNSTETLTKKTKTPNRAILLAAFVWLSLAKWACNFENLADLKFLSPSGLAGRSIPLDLYFSLGLGAPDEIQILPCDALKSDVVHQAQQPLLFKGCIDNAANKSVLEDLTIFPESTANIFPKCHADKAPFNSFQFEDLEGNKTDIFEMLPCDRATLAEKVDIFRQHQLDRNGAYFDVHTVLLDKAMEGKLSDRLVERGFVPDGFHAGGRLGQTVMLAHFFSAGMTAVDYYHSHPDRSLSFGMGKTKVWELINPRYHDNFGYEWSGQANVITHEKVAGTPRVITPQELGDVMLLPPWWIHKTQHEDSSYSLSTKAASFNIHFMTPRSALGISAYVAMRVLGLQDWFFANSR